MGGFLQNDILAFFRKLGQSFLHMRFIQLDVKFSLAEILDDTRQLFYVFVSTHNKTSSYY